MVGNNPIVLVGTKMDLLPVGCSPKEVAEWLTEAAGRRRLQVGMGKGCALAVCAHLGYVRVCSNSAPCAACILSVMAPKWHAKSLPC